MKQVEANIFILRQAGRPVGEVFYKDYSSAESSMKRCLEKGMSDITITELTPSDRCKECSRPAVAWHWTGTGFCKVHS